MLPGCMPLMMTRPLHCLTRTCMHPHTNIRDETEPNPKRQFVPAHARRRAAAKVRGTNWTHTVLTHALILRFSCAPHAVTGRTLGELESLTASCANTVFVCPYVCVFVCVFVLTCTRIQQWTSVSFYVHQHSDLLEFLLLNVASIAKINILANRGSSSFSCMQGF